jgi:hypothetical protein
LTYPGTLTQQTRQQGGWGVVYGREIVEAEKKNKERGKE